MTDAPRPWSRGRRWLPWLGLGVLVAVVLVWAAWPAGAASPAERAHALATELRCPDCEGLSVADSSTSTARAIRTEIRQLVDHHESDAQIKQVYVDRYGDSILLEPAKSGFSLLVWLLPVVVIIAAALGLMLAMRRWRRIPRLTATADDASLVAELRTRASTGGPSGASARGPR